MPAKTNDLKSALVLGCSGQDGLLITESLLKQNYQVVGLSRNKAIENLTIPSNKLNQKIQIEKGDIKDPTILKRLIEKFNPNEIYNLAAQSSVGISFKKPRDTIEGIVNGTLNILEICRELTYEGRIFFAGSGEIFGNTNVGATINNHHQPINPYSIAKQTSFNLVKIYRESYNLNCVTGVLFNHESSLRNDNFVTQKIISGAIKCLSDQSHILHLGNIDISRDWGWAPEYIDAIQLITNAPILKDHVICTGKLTTLESFIEIAFNKLGLDWRKHVKSDKTLFRNSDIKKNYGNPDELFKSLGWKAKTGVDELINKLIEAKLN